MSDSLINRLRAKRLCIVRASDGRYILCTARGVTVGTVNKKRVDAARAQLAPSMTPLARDLATYGVEVWIPREAAPPNTPTVAVARSNEGQG